ncbi:MAG: SufB/SufD family protein [Minisyncoccia bacterium]
MRNVKSVTKKSANFYYLNHALVSIYAPFGVEILESFQAYQKYPWAKQYFNQIPKEGYFIWVKKQQSNPLSTCVAISQSKINQQLQNLLIIEKGLTIESFVSCSALANGLCANHYAQGKIILKEGASLIYKHLHSWGEHDYVEPDYEFILEKGAKLNYLYQLLNPPKELNFKTKIILKEKASANINVGIRSKNTAVNLEEEMDLLGKNSQGAVYLRLVADKNAQIKAVNKLVAQAEGKGHLDCRGIILDHHSSIELVPALINRNKESILTHEASIGKINQEEINYLRSRGLTQKEAVNLIVNGFLKITNDKE